MAFLGCRRPEGPVVNSHAREGVVNRVNSLPRPEGPTVDFLYTFNVHAQRISLPVLRTSTFSYDVHDLTVVAIHSRSFRT